MGDTHGRTGVFEVDRPIRAPRVLLPGSLRVADGLGADSVAFPAISTGVYGWPMDDGSRIAVRTVRDADTAVTAIRFVLFDDAAVAAFKTATAE